MAQSEADSDERRDVINVTFREGKDTVNRLDKIIKLQQINEEIPMYWTRADVLRLVTREWIQENEDILDDDEETEASAAPPVRK